MSPSRRPAPRVARTTVALVAALLLALVAGCGVRLETPPPAALTPGVDESARQRAAADAVALGVLAGDAGPPVDPAADPVAAARASVAAAARTHLDALGGLYDDGLDPEARERPDRPAASPSPSPSAPPAAVPPDAVVAALTEAAAAARADVAVVTDGGLARLLASLSVSRLLSASRLATAAGLTPPACPDVVVPAAAPGGVRAPTSRRWSRPRTPPATRSRWSRPSTPTTCGRAPGPGRWCTAPAHRRGPRPAGSPGRAWTRAGSPTRCPAGSRTRRPRPRWSPARDHAGGDYLALVARVAPADRAALADAAAEATAQALAWGAPLPALPGMPDVAAG